jgi:hypothetical protein
MSVRLNVKADGPKGLFESKRLRILIHLEFTKTLLSNTPIHVQSTLKTTLLMGDLK